MLIQKYGLSLRTIKNTDLEQLCTWRNADHVRLQMQYQEHLSLQMQEQWFASLRPEQCIYLIIQSSGKEVGLINLKDLDLNTRTAEAGIFIGDQNFLNSTVPVLATIILMELAFDTLTLKTLRAKINTNNLSAVKFNTGLGYQMNESSKKEEFQYFESTRPRFVSSTLPLRDMLAKLNRDGASLEVTKKEIGALKLSAGQLRANWENIRILD